MRSVRFAEEAAKTRAKLTTLLNHPGHPDQKSHGRKGGAVDGLTRGEPRSAQAAAEGCNPGYGTTASGPTYRGKDRWDPEMGPPPSGAYEENCTNSVMAFEMRARGYDVEAAPLAVLDRYGYAAGRTVQEVDDLVARAWSNPDGTPHGRSFSEQPWRPLKQVDAEVKSWPEGGRGFVTVGKHVFSIVRRRGKAEYVESQFGNAGASRSVTREYKKKWGDGENAKVVRLDDLAPTDAIFEAIAVPE